MHLEASLFTYAIEIDVYIASADRRRSPEPSVGSQVHDGTFKHRAYRVHSGTVRIPFQSKVNISGCM